MKTSSVFQHHTRELILALGIAGCATDTVSLGEERLSQDLAGGARCAGGAVLEADVRVQSQAELDALAGCEIIQGDLALEIFEAADLSPLASLRIVGGTLYIGADPEPDTRPGTLEELLAREAERDALIERRREIAEAGWLESLHGVEAIEQVGSLRLSSISSPDLRAFSNLRNVSAHRVGPNAGTVSVTAAAHLLDLAGLEGVTGIRVLALHQNPLLESLDGVTLGTALDGVSIARNPRLHDLDALSSVRNLRDSFTLSATGVRDLNALTTLENSLGGVVIENNPELTDASGLNTLSIADEVVISGNSKLRRLPEFPDLTTPARLTITDNPALETIDIDSPGLAFGELMVIGERFFPGSAELILISGNDALSSLSLPNGYPGARVFAIQGNASLVSIDFGNLERAEVLTIEGNPRLSQVSLGQLRAVDTLEVLNNPELPTAALAGVPSFESTFVGNADSPAP